MTGWVFLLAGAVVPGVIAVRASLAGNRAIAACFAAIVGWMIAHLMVVVASMVVW